MFACFFQTNFPNIPFLKPKLLSFLVAPLFLLLFLFSCFMFLPSVFMLALFLVRFSFVLVLFYFGCCFAFTDYEKHCFPCNSSVFVVLVTR